VTRAPRDARKAPGRPRSRDPYGLLPAGFPIAPVLAVVGLVVVAFVTLNLFNGDLPISPGGNAAGPEASGAVEAPRTPTPSNVVIVPTPEPGIQVPGTLVYAKDGNIWLQTGDNATQLTSSGNDSMPSFSADGKYVYFVRTRRTDGRWSIGGSLKDYRLDVPSLMRVSPSGGAPEKLLDGIINPAGSLKWSGFIREPVVSPNGRYVAMATDLPDPTKSDVTLKLLDLKTDKIKDLRLAQVPPLGHQDPAWRPDGSRLLYVQNNRDGAKGTPRIYSWSPDTGKARAVTGPGYLHPSWSPDGRYIAATRTSAYGTDVVILSASTGAEVQRLTDDGNSWAPTWSPAGNQVAFLHVAGQVIDLRMIQLDGTGPNWTIKDPIDLTNAAGLDGVSRPDWFVPPDQIPATPAPAASAPAAPTASPTGS
jgi:TolB protein